MAWAVIRLKGVVPGAVRAIAVVAPGDMRRVASAAIVSARLGIITVVWNAKAKVESGINMPANIRAVIAPITPVVVVVVVAKLATAVSSATIAIVAAIAAIGDL